MEEENKTFDNSVPEPSKEAVKTNEEKREELKNLALGAAVASYGYIKDLKANGHNSLGNLIFQDSMKILTSAGIASGSIGRDRFTEHLEDGFYASGRLLVYLDFAQYLTTNDAIRLELIESITTLHKIFAASVKTVRSKNPMPANVPVAV